MCLMCGDATFAHGFVLVSRPAHRLTGRFWTGTFANAGNGALHPLLAEVKALSASTSDLWKSPIVGLTWLDRPGGFRYFAGIETADEAASAGFERLEVPQMYCAGLWHGADDGSVTESYAKLMGDLDEAGIARDTGFCHQREEYAADIDLSKPPSLRLMLPVRADGAKPAE
ncbi:MAG: GyrI-like domain-containing protein [Rhizobiaceae bacterium]|nr:GyrI-like domain-containing protein [Rhizobiaceae bacterium]